MTNDGQADVVALDPQTGDLTLWENYCPTVPSSDPTLTCDPSDPEPGYVIASSIEPCWDGYNYHTVDEVERGRAEFPEYCVDTYLLNALSETMNSALEKFDDIMSNSYHARYKAFANMVRSQALDSWQTIWSHSETYWNCYDMVKGEKTPTPCIRDKLAELWEPKDGLCDMLDKDHQFNCSLISYPATTVSEPDHGCALHTENDPSSHPRTVHYPKYEHDLDVPDPAEAITKSLQQYRDYSHWLSSVSGAAQIGQFEESEGDVVDASVITILSVQAAAEAMQAVSEEGEHAIEQKRKETIIAFVSAFLLVIPGLGEAAGVALNVARLARLAAVVDVAGNTALGIYEIVDNPDSGPSEVIGLIFGALGARSNFGWSKAAGKARKIDDAVLNKLGHTVAAGAKKTRKLVGRCG